MALPRLPGETVPWVDDCSRTATPTPYSGVAGMPRNRWLASVGIAGWFASECPAGIRRITQVITLDALCREVPPGGPLSDVLADQVAQIQYTSGTTGFPKGAMLTHRGLVNNAQFCAQTVSAGPDDVW